MEGSEGFVWAAPFNRTILELKPRRGRVINCFCAAFNRTILELKHLLLHYFDFSIYSFNRTILELKRIYNRQLSDERPLLIAPFWN